MDWGAVSVDGLRALALLGIDFLLFRFVFATFGVTPKGVVQWIAHRWFRKATDRDR